MNQFTNISHYKYNAPISAKGRDLLREMDKLSIKVQQSHDDKSVMLTSVLFHTQHKSTNKEQYSPEHKYMKNC
jgi:hypothetical protein